MKYLVEPIQWTTTRGCICPPTSEQTCQSLACARKPISSNFSPPEKSAEIVRLRARVQELEAALRPCLRATPALEDERMVVMSQHEHDAIVTALRGEEE